MVTVGSRCGWFAHPFTQFSIFSGLTSLHKKNKIMRERERKRERERVDPIDLFSINDSCTGKQIYNERRRSEKFLISDPLK